MLTWIAGVGAFLCLLYYAVITVYAGFTVSFSWFWVAAAGFLGIVAWGSRYCRLHPKRFPLWLPVSVMTCLITGLVIFCAVEVLIFLGAATSDTPGLDYVIVLGAKVQKQGISNSLKQRLDKAVEYSRKSPGTVFILSGGQGADEPETEAQAMYEYLINNGVPSSRLVMEPSSASTVENIAYSRLVIERLENNRRELAKNNRNEISPGPYLQVEEKPLQIGILTSSFHVFRATMIARMQGLTDIHGISARSDFLLFPHLCVRECAAVLKDRLMGNM